MIDTQFIRSLEWRAFENLCYHILSIQNEYDIEINSGGSDKGADIIAKDKETGEILEIMQCKAYSKGNKITADKMRDFMGSMQIFNVKKASYVTTSFFTADATQLAKQFNISIYTTDDIIQVLQTLPRTKQDHIENSIKKTDFTTPTCPSCMVKMVKRITKKGIRKGNPFWGCPNFPKCKNILHFRKVDQDTEPEKTYTVNNASETTSARASARENKHCFDATGDRSSSSTMSPFRESVFQQGLAKIASFVVYRNKPRKRKKTERPLVQLLWLKIGVSVFAGILCVAMFYGLYSHLITSSKEQAQQPISQQAHAQQQKMVKKQLAPQAKESTNRPSIPIAQNAQNISKSSSVTKLSCWSTHDNQTFCSANSYSVPKKDYKQLVYVTLNREKMYCWENSKGQKLYSNGLPHHTGSDVYKFISVN